MDDFKICDVIDNIIDNNRFKKLTKESIGSLLRISIILNNDKEIKIQHHINYYTITINKVSYQIASHIYRGFFRPLEDSRMTLLWRKIDGIYLKLEQDKFKKELEKINE